jgi:hypothetical protein
MKIGYIKYWFIFAGISLSVSANSQTVQHANEAFKVEAVAEHYRTAYTEITGANQKELLDQMTLRDFHIQIRQLHTNLQSEVTKAGFIWDADGRGLIRFQLFLNAKSGVDLFAYDLVLPKDLSPEKRNELDQILSRFFSNLAMNATLKQPLVYNGNFGFTN